MSYPFDGLVGFNHAGLLGEVLRFARTVNAREIDIVGHRGAVRLSNGQTLVEDATIGKRRAEQVAMLLRGANLKDRPTRSNGGLTAAAATGVDDHLSRRVTITVRPQ